MTNELTVFKYEGREIRTVENDGETWFVAKEICDVLEIEQPTRATERLDEDEKGVTTIHTLGGPQEMVIISEPGMYKLVLTSRKPEAKTFSRWVAHEVLPQIRKTGSYSPPAALTPAEMFLQNAQVLVTFEKELTAVNARVQKLEAHVQSGTGFFSILAWCNLNKYRMDKNEMSKRGRHASGLSRAKGVMIGHVRDERWAEVGTYHESILKEVFADLEKP